MKETILAHVTAHPSMTEQDMIKLCYQAVFGAEHLLTDRAKAWAYFEYEWNNTPEKEMPLFEPLSIRYARIHLAAWKHQRLPADWLFRIFYMTASSPSGASDSDFNTLLDVIDKLADQKSLPFAAAEWRAARNNYLRNGGGAVHHSEKYRNAEHPAYRVIDRRYIALIPLLTKIAKIQPRQGETATIAIDGRAASGKTTLAQMLANILDAGVVHMDDFFLPPELRTQERLAEPGGNVHYERFTRQVIPHLKNNGSFDYPVFDCSKMQLDGVKNVSAGQWRVVEGSYSHHPKLSRYMDLRVFCLVSPEEQMRRILTRNGETMAKMFAERWIPMEERYFNTFHIAEDADIIIDTEEKPL